MSEDLRYYCKVYDINEDMQQLLTELEEQYKELHPDSDLVQEVLEMGNEIPSLQNNNCRDNFMFGMGVALGTIM